MKCQWMLILWNSYSEWAFVIYPENTWVYLLKAKQENNMPIQIIFQVTVEDIKMRDVLIIFLTFNRADTSSLWMVGGVKWGFWKFHQSWLFTHDVGNPQKDVGHKWCKYWSSDTVKDMYIDIIEKVSIDFNGYQMLINWYIYFLVYLFLYLATNLSFCLFILNKMSGATTYPK